MGQFEWVALFNGNKLQHPYRIFPKPDLIFILLNAQANQQRSLDHLISIEIVHRFKFKQKLSCDFLKIHEKVP